MSTDTKSKKKSKPFKNILSLPGFSLLRQEKPNLDKEIELCQDPAIKNKELEIEIIRYLIEQDRKERLYQRIFSAGLCFIGIVLFIIKHQEIGLFILGVGLYQNLFLSKSLEKSFLLDKYEKIVDEQKNQEDNKKIETK